MKLLLEDSNIRAPLRQQKSGVRQIIFGDGTSMNDGLYLVETDAPRGLLKSLLNKSNQVYVDGGDYENVPNWMDEITKQGYDFKYLEEVEARNHADLEDKHPEVTEVYIIDSQPASRGRKTRFVKESLDDDLCGESKDIVFECMRFNDDMYDRIMEGSNADLVDNIRQIFADLGGSCKVRIVNSRYIKFSGALPNPSKYYGDTDWTFGGDIPLEDLRYRARRLAEDLTMWYYRNELGGTKIKNTPALINCIRNIDKIGKTAVTEALDTRNADFTVDLVEFKDDGFEDFDVLETIPVTVDEIIDRYGEKAYKAAVKGITREMLKDGIKTNSTLGILITGVAEDKATKKDHRSKYGYGYENIRLVNDNLFDTNIGSLQKKLGKMLLPPEGWTGRRVKESYTGNRYDNVDVGDEIEFYDNNNRFKGTVTGFAHKGNAIFVQGKSGTTYKIDRNGKLLPCIDEIRCGGRTERFGDDLKWHRT